MNKNQTTSPQRPDAWQKQGGILRYKRKNRTPEKNVSNAEMNAIEEPENHEQSFREFLRLLADHFTNGKLTAYTFYY